MRVGWIVLAAALSSCAMGPRTTDWIKPGVTTQEEVVEYFGSPDFIVHNPPYLTAIYRGRTVEPASSPSVPMLVPTVRGAVPMESAPLEPVSPGAERQARRPPDGFRVTYDQDHRVTRLEPGSPTEP